MKPRVAVVGDYFVFFVVVGEADCVDVQYLGRSRKEDLLPDFETDLDGESRE